MKEALPKSVKFLPFPNTNTESEFSREVASNEDGS